MIIDCHNHIGYDAVYLEERTTIDLLNEMDENNVDKAVIFPFTTNPDIINQNKLILEATRKHPDRFIGFFTMNPKLLEMTDLMIEYKSLGFKGVVLDLRFGAGFHDRRVHELMECAYSLGLVVWIHSDEKDSPLGMGSLENLIHKFSGVNYIISSMFRDVFYIVTKNRNMFIDSAVFELSQDLTKLIHPIGAHRILLGSNTPEGVIKGEINKIMISPELSKYQKKLILGENILRILKI
jgi:predicted TIM-barrel fold metal-dependent hydrolase